MSFMVFHIFLSYITITNQYFKMSLNHVKHKNTINEKQSSKKNYYLAENVIISINISFGTLVKEVHWRKAKLA